MKIIHLILVAASMVLAAEPKSPPAQVAAQKPEPAVVTMTIRQLLRAGTSQALGKLGEQDLPALAAYRVNKIIDALQPELKRAVADRDKLFTDDISEPVPNGQPGARQIKPGKEADFEAKVKPLMEEKISILAMPLVLETDLAGAKISAHDIEDLGPLLVSESDVKK